MYSMVGSGVIGEELVTSFGKKNLLVNSNLYNPYVLVGNGDGTNEMFVMLPNMYAHLENGKKYKFSCDVDGVWGATIKTDTVEVWLFKDKKMVIDGHNNGGHFSNTNINIFTLTSDTGDYYVRIDNNDNSKTHAWKNFRIVEV